MNHTNQMFTVAVMGGMVLLCGPACCPMYEETEAEPAQGVFQPDLWR